jgi:DNA-directed RNA polymerase subunit alpha
MMWKRREIDMELPGARKRWRQGNYGSYEIGPMSPDLALSLANSLRRVLLSGLPGAAITAVRIDGAQHEYQDILNVKEDVTDIVQNLKQIRLRCFSDRAVLMYLDAQEEGIVRASDIDAPGTIEIVTPSAHIATLDNANARLSMEMTVSVGRGFVAFDRQDAREMPRGVIPIDAIYSPIRHVNFTRERVQDGWQEALETILLEITTDGTISPDEALRQAADILRRQFAVFVHSTYEGDTSHKSTRASDVLIPRWIYGLSIDKLDLPVRIVNSLRRWGITCVGAVLERDEKELLALRNVGEKALQQIADDLKMKDLLPKL